ncbi:hypothetical protein R5W23_005286 [Gemmata sp. JC673]|uniref:Uncharacterized protein n=1 Tax=Gemmata algarum TaxID=2975278 RepID=A0ABU5FAC7_9BACT|nr:hypothetical protein [Gemmata algarum]MDY3563670.1 hypothetical protein [Gemmata algarum]
MRARNSLRFALGLLAALALTTAARPQDDPFGGLRPYYWPHRSFGFPIDPDAVAKMDPKPTHIQLYYTLNRGTFQKGPKLPLTGLSDINGNKKGIIFDAPRDGDYEFVGQYIFANGEVNPKFDALAATIRVVIDTTFPRVQLAPLGSGVEWRATDDNLDPAGVTLECKWPTSSEWTKIDAPNRVFKANDSYAWKIPPGKSLDVRVIARDRAGHEGSSPVVRIPAESGTTVGLPKGSGGTFTGTTLPQPRIDFVNRLDFTVESTVQKMGRSGVQAAHLYVQKDQGDWTHVARYEKKLTPDSKGPHKLSLPYKAEREGTYGFYIIPESGAGAKADPPKKDDPAMVLVVVDTKPPEVQITAVQVKPGGVRGPLVEITWTVADPNLMPQPVSLEWSLDRSAKQWNEIKYRLDNNLTPTSGRYAWEVPDDKVWKFYVRVRALDKAANEGERIWDKEVVVDLEKPSATIDRVRGGSEPEKPPAAEKLPAKSDQAP